MQHVSTYNSHLQAKLRTVNALECGCVHLGSYMAYSVFMYKINHSKNTGIPNAHNHPIKR